MLNQIYLAETWFQLLNSCLSYDVPNIRIAAIEALPALLNEYYQAPTETQKTRNAQIIDDYLQNLLSVNTEVSRIGHALALGALPKFMLQGHLENIINSLIHSLTITTETAKWAESRRDAVKAIASICVTMTDSIGTGKFFKKRYALGKLNLCSTDFELQYSPFMVSLK